MGLSINSSQGVDIPSTQTITGSKTLSGTTSITTNALDLQVGQIAFPATQNASAGANTLDDYEEGTWTPAANSFTTVGSLSVANGTYVKAGRYVFIQGIITYTTSIAGTAGTSFITGLPFTPANPGAGGGYANNSTGAPTGTGAAFPTGNFFSPTFSAMSTITFSLSYQV